MSNRHLYQRRYPIDAHPFEAFYDDSWWDVECIRIKDGIVTTHLEYHGFKIEEEIPLPCIRVRSRTATLSDCTCFLRPGVDICVLLTDPSEATSDQAWIDAKINSIERKRHESRCTCRFFLSFDEVDHPFLVDNDMLKGGVKEEVIDNIAILQQLDRNPCEEGCYRWTLSKDCPSRNETKLSRGKFSVDVSWMLVASMLKGVGFEVRSMQNKMMYEVLDKDQDSCVKIINFQKDDQVMKPNIKTFVLEVPVETFVTDNTEEMDPHEDLEENGFCSSPLYKFMYLRRSERRNVQPERFVSHDLPSRGRSSAIWTEKGRRRQWKEMEMAENDGLIHEHYPEPKTEDEEVVHITSNFSDWKFPAKQIKVESNESGLANGPSKRRVKSSPSNNANFNLEASSFIPFPITDHSNIQIQLHENSSASANRIKVKTTRNLGMKSPKLDLSRGSIETQRKMMRKRQHWDLDYRLKEMNSHKRIRSRSYFWSKWKMCYSTNIRKSLSEHEDIIKSCMKNIGLEIEKSQLQAVSPGEAIHSVFPYDQRMFSWPEDEEQPADNNQIENPELEALWKEMEISMSALHFLDESQNNVLELSNEVVNGSNAVDGWPCEHEFKLDEEFGLVCQLCSFVRSEARYVFPPFVQNTLMIRDEELCRATEMRFRDTNDQDLDLPSIPTSSKGLSLQENNDNVWTLIPDFRNKFHTHQKKAFEFLWKNTAGSTVPADMDAVVARKTGCVISHSPGSGKTLLVISFLVSYLRLFPSKRPLILAPKTTLYTWFREFRKWEVPIPLYQIHPRKNYRKELKSQGVGQALGEYRASQDVMHAIDCLVKLQKWHEHPSVLLVGYPFFMSLMRENSRSKHWRYMARILKKSPGIMILDEGHNPRSTRSMLRKSLMKVETEQRILLSGTLFQNNFEEYFNTLCLARPCFIDEVLKKLGPTMKTNHNWKKKPLNSKERQARKFFVEKIAQRINSQVDRERSQGLNILKKITNGFIDVYEAGASDRLPGLHCYTLLINSTEIQKELLVKLLLHDTGKRYPIELELLVTVISIHPWLIKTLAYAYKYFGTDELQDLEKHKMDVKKGSKVRFVVNLVHQCIIKKEKVLIFCRNIAPIKLFVEIFEKMFGWSKGDEVLVLYGEQELYERARVIDKFEDPGGPSQVLLASIAACSEGISLTAASRVVMLDSEWNPSKTKQAIARAFRPGQERVVYVYQLLASGTLEEGKYDKKIWKERMSRMIFVGEGVEDSCCRETDEIDDEVLRGIVDEDEAKTIQMIMKDEKLSSGSSRGKEAALF